MCTAIPPTLLSIRSHSPVCSPARISSPSSRTASEIARAQRIARAGPSNVAKKPSPAVSISVAAKTLELPPDERVVASTDRASAASPSSAAVPSSRRCR